jgi:hypothetical protein
MSERTTKTSRRKTKHLQDFFLSAVRSESGLLTFACEKAGINREVHRKWLSCDPAYRTRFQVTMQEADDARFKVCLLRSYESARRGSVQMRKCLKDLYGPALLAAVLAGKKPELS